MSSHSIWFSQFRSEIPDRSINQFRLFCFPYAGGGASTFRTWATELPPEIEVCAVQLPGRETRAQEPCLTSLSLLIQQLLPELYPYLDRPYALFGHSMGAVISFELARQLRQHPVLQPSALIVSARRAPQLAERNPIAGLPDAEFIAALRDYQGTPESVLQNGDLMQWFLPILKADFSLVETYQYRDEPPLHCPILAFGGIEDRQIDPVELEAWQQQTCDRFTTHWFPSHHFFISTVRSQVLQKLMSELNSCFTAKYRSSGIRAS